MAARRMNARRGGYLTRVIVTLFFKPAHHAAQGALAPQVRRSITLVAMCASRFSTSNARSAYSKTSAEPASCPCGMVMEEAST